MKLLRFKIGNLPEGTQFRSLYSGFEILFHEPEVEGMDTLGQFNPFCFAGLNGRGKSNVLEALATIFSHLECCVAKFLPKTFVSFRPEVCAVDAFIVEYLIQRPNSSYSLDNFDRITVSKKSGEAPKMYRSTFPSSDKREKISLKPFLNKSRDIVESAPGKLYLPDIIVGYSSGENEILSVPFRKSRLINFDKYTEDFFRNRTFEMPENSLIYIDAGMSQAVLLANLLFEDHTTTLSSFKKILKIRDILSFRMNINLHRYSDEQHRLIVEHIQGEIEKLKKCATCYYEQPERSDEEGSGTRSLVLDFYVNDVTRTLFRKYFKSAFNFFRFFQVLYELNNYFIPEKLKQDVYTSKGVYTEGKLPEGSPEQNIFYFLDFFILKETGANTPPKPLLLKELSDGEHQFIHSMCVCLMLRDQRSLLLLDEPETHFNPEWRSKFIQMLNRSLQVCGNVNLQQDVIITSHSPFIISDCKPYNVIIFKPNEHGQPTAMKAAALHIKTYGMSVNLLTTRVFEEGQTIGDYALEKIRYYRCRLSKGERIENLLDEINRELGDSVEKLLLIHEFNTYNQ